MWRFRVLGDIALSTASGDTRRPSANKYAFLLAFLATRPDRAFSREELIDVFWPDSDLEHGRMCLRAALSSLRRQLDAPGLFLEGGRELVRINGDLITTDAAEFEAAVQTGRPEVRSFYGGEFLPGCYDDWAVLERCRLDLLVEEAAGAPETSIPASSLPNPASRFCGRVLEVEETVVKVRSARLVSLVGLGGMGKTRLSIESGRALQGDLRVIFLPLAKIKRAAELNGLAADALGVAKSPSETLSSRIASAIAKCPTLLILDNYEHLLDDRSAAEWTAQLLEQVGSLKCLVTSRIPLGIEGERVLPVEPLSPEDAKEMLLDRAWAAHPGFDDSGPIDRLCARLDRMPLAITLCAARANVLTAEEILDRLDKGADAREDLPLRGRLRGVLEWTCPPGNPRHDALLALTAFAGGWTFDAAQAVLGQSALEHLAGLRQRSLLRVESTPEGNRFYMLDAVRDYALESGDPEKIREARRAHSRYYCDLAWNLADLHIRDEWAAFRGLDAARSNIFAAYEFAMEDGENRSEALRSLYHARWALWVRGNWPMLLRIYTIAEGVLRDTMPGIARGRIYRLTGDAAAHRGDFALAIARLDQATDEFLLAGDLLCACDAQQGAGEVCLLAKRWDEAIAHFQRQIGIIEQGDVRGRHVAQAGLANAYTQKGDHERAIELYGKLAAFWATQADSDGHRAMIARGHALCLAAQGHAHEAIERLEPCAETFRRMGLSHWERLTWEELAQLYRQTGQTTQAEHAHREHARLQDRP